jgi:hypothetical protein
VRLTLRSFEGGIRPIAPSAGSGDPVRQPDLIQGATSLAIVELPGDGTSALTAPVAMVAAGGTSPGWRRAALFRYDLTLEAAEPIGGTAARAVLGRAQAGLAAAAPWRLDLLNTVEVVLDDVSNALTSAAEDQLINGANLCQIGEELLQFGHAEWLSPGRYRLSRLVRGRYGTEWASTEHEALERFVLLETERLAPVPILPRDVGAVLTIRAVGSGDATPAEAQRWIDGRAMMPPAPVHGCMMRRENGDVEISWVRRSRLGWTWIDGADAPLGEEQEAYVVTVKVAGQERRRWETSVPSVLYPAADLALDVSSAPFDQLSVEIRQIGSWGLSRPLRLVMA